ncbi:hypothetical protein CWS01_06385 [Niallia nealsonii]|uniref:Uncharacterized protein n=1 Tax=Niallia nealsonii TaxID=115979 RepID=A0A2N0Z4I2_9BACI|nr:hypothetical protein CWS01_06385 [Niallia nealsonii]
MDLTSQTLKTFKLNAVLKLIVDFCTMLIGRRRCETPAGEERQTLTLKGQSYEAVRRLLAENERLSLESIANFNRAKLKEI